MNIWNQCQSETVANGFIASQPEDRKNRTLQYSLSHCITHLVAAGMKEDAKKLLLNVDWLMTRASDGIHLIEDCKRVENDRVVEIIGSAIDLSLNDLRKDPRRMVGQLVGRLMWTAGERSEEERKEGGETKKNHDQEEIDDLCSRLKGWHPEPVGPMQGGPFYCAPDVLGWEVANPNRRE